MGVRQQAKCRTFIFYIGPAEKGLDSSILFASSLVSWSLNITAVALRGKASSLRHLLDNAFAFGILSLSGFTWYTQIGIRKRFQSFRAYRLTAYITQTIIAGFQFT